MDNPHWTPHIPIFSSPRCRSNNNIGDSGAAAVAAGLKGLTLLKSLHLYHNGIGGAGGLAVAREAAQLPALQELILRARESGNGMDAATQATIREMLPHVKDLLLS